MSKARLNISMDDDLVDFIKVYAKENRTTAADVFTQFVLSLRKKFLGDSMDIILADPDFHKAVVDTKERIQNGTTRWYSFDEVFGD